MTSGAPQQQGPQSLTALALGEALYDIARYAVGTLGKLLGKPKMVQEK